MAQIPDPTGPTTSYSDPIYDRLETVAQRVTRWLGLILLALVIIIVIAVIMQRHFADNPETESANAFLTAEKALQEAQNQPPGEKNDKLAVAEKSLQVLAANEKMSPYFRARACIELVQSDLNNKALTDARAHAEKGIELAGKTDDKDLGMKAALSAAAVSLQAGQFDDALKRYETIERQAGAKSPDNQIAAVMGASLTLETQGKLEDAAAKLEPLTNRVDANAQFLIDIAREHYWRLKSQIADKTRPHRVPKPAPAPGAPAAPATPPGTTIPVAPASTPVPTPTIQVAPVPSAPAPVAPAPVPTAPVPTAPTTPAPAAK